MSIIIPNQNYRLVVTENSVGQKLVSDDDDEEEEEEETGQKKKVSPSTSFGRLN